MASTLVVSMFLPNTVSFVNPPKRDMGRMQPFKTHQCNTSSLALSGLVNDMSLFDKRPAATTPTATREFFLDVAEAPLQSLLDAASNLRSSMPSESYATEWGSETIYNQPRSRVAQLPPDNIIAFGDYLERKSRLAERSAFRLPKCAATSPTTPTFERRGSDSDREGNEQEWKIMPSIHSNGGLVNAMRAESDFKFNADTTWIGTIGFPIDSLSGDMKDEILDVLQNEHQSKVVYCSDKDFDGHYKHYCKVMLWPIFHYQVPDHAKSKAYEDHSWEFYVNVNRAFANTVIETYKKGDTIWIHDYHLLLVPRMVREKRPEAKIGLFLHTAFPSAEIFRCLARKKELLKGMLGADLIGFQCKEYTDHFLSTCAQILMVETTAEGVQLEEYFVNVMHQSMGINPALFECERRHDEALQWINELTEKYKGKKIIVARDKLDQVHGVRQKLQAYETFLKRHPEMKDNVVMIQIATAERQKEQSDLLAVVSDICSRVDSEYSNLSHQPLVFLRQDLTVHAYLALLSIADILMISSLREGMGLTAHDFVFCQDGQLSAKKHGPIILSEFTGSAAVFEGRFAQKSHPTHLSINPWDNSGMADAILKALKMSDAEKEVRWRRLHGVVLEQTGAFWAQRLQETLDVVHEKHHQSSAIAVPRLKVPQLVGAYSEAARRLFMVDYEGTIMPQKPGMPFQPISHRRVVQTLGSLLTDPANIIYVMSGRMRHELEDTFRTLPEIGLIAENGGYIRNRGQTEWAAMVDESRVLEWKAEVQPILDYYLQRIEGSWVEERQCSILFHYEACPEEETAKRLASECASQIDGDYKSLSLRAVHLPKAVLIEMQDFNKSTAADRVFSQLSSVSSDYSYPSSPTSPISMASSPSSASSRAPDFIMVAGDDREDEGVFRWANALGNCLSSNSSDKTRPPGSPNSPKPMKLGDESPPIAASVTSEPMVRHVFTVTVGRRNTEAQATLEQGPTSLLNVLDRLAKASPPRVWPADDFRLSTTLPKHRSFPT